MMHEINVLAQNEWVRIDSTKKKKNDENKKDNKSNTIALIVSLISEFFPDSIEQCSENKFINFQDKLTKIISKL